MSQREALFAGLIYSEEGELVEVVEVGGEPFYAIPDDDFLWHVEVSHVDRQVLVHLKGRLLPMKDTLVEGVLQLTGSDDPFSRAAVEMSLENLDRLLEMDRTGVDIADMRLGLWMTGFRVVVDFHGDVVDLELPGLEDLS